jgi:hypothetical protein
MGERYSIEQLQVLENLEVSIKNMTGEGELPIDARYINEGKGSFGGCLRNLHSLHALKFSHAWFACHDLEESKLQAFIASKLHYIQCVEIEPQGMTLESQYFYALMSDHESIIRWMMSLEPASPAGLKLINNPAQHFFRQWQMTLALRGDWKSLGERAARFLSDVPPKMKKWAIDMRFYLALSKGEKTAMEDVLGEFQSEKVARIRNEVFELPFPSAFISNYATMYAKIASRHGHQVQFEDRLIPVEWVPVRPLSSYPDPYHFMSKYRIGSSSSAA